MHILSYDQLKSRFIQSERTFRNAFTKDEYLMKSVIAIIANTKNDNGWPLAMLDSLQPQLAEALRHWSAGGYEDIRRAQETDTVRFGTHANNLETHFSLLPPWHGDAQHFSKDPGWFDKVACGTLELKSFMGCCSPGHIFAYATRPAAVLRFTALKTARLVGALTTENMEGEVLLPKGAIFRVVSEDKFTNIISLEEMGA